MADGLHGRRVPGKPRANDARSANETNISMLVLVSVRISNEAPSTVHVLGICTATFHCTSTDLNRRAE
jgi:hypothetical protein